MRSILNRIRALFGAPVASGASGLAYATDPLESTIYSVCEEADKRGLDALSETQRAVVLAWGATGIIGNGGFRYFYEGEWRMAELGAAYRALGFGDAADACERSLDVFPGRVVPRDQHRRSEILERIDQTQLESLQGAVFAIGWDALRDAIGQYMARHASEFVRFRGGAG